MKNIVYLVGQISLKNTKTYEWRRNVRNEFKGTNYDVEIIDPCFNEWNLNILASRKSDVYKENVTGILSPKDKHYVKLSNIIIYNAIQYDRDKPLIGSMFELALASEYSDKIVIGVSPVNNIDIYRIHPFIQNAVHLWVETEVNACDVIKEMCC